MSKKEIEDHEKIRIHSCFDNKRTSCIEEQCKEMEMDPRSFCHSICTKPEHVCKRTTCEVYEKEGSRYPVCVPSNVCSMKRHFGPDIDEESINQEHDEANDNAPDSSNRISMDTYRESAPTSDKQEKKIEEELMEQLSKMLNPEQMMELTALCGVDRCSCCNCVLCRCHKELEEQTTTEKNEKVSTSSGEAEQRKSSNERFSSSVESPMRKKPAEKTEIGDISIERSSFQGASVKEKNTEGTEEGSMKSEKSRRVSTEDPVDKILDKVGEKNTEGAEEGSMKSKKSGKVSTGGPVDELPNGEASIKKSTVGKKSRKDPNREVSTEKISSKTSVQKTQAEDDFREKISNEKVSIGGTTSGKRTSLVEATSDERGGEEKEISGSSGDQQPDTSSKKNDEEKTFETPDKSEDKEKEGIEVSDPHEEPEMIIAGPEDILLQSLPQVAEQTIKSDNVDENQEGDEVLHDESMMKTETTLEDGTMVAEMKAPENESVETESATLKGLIETSVSPEKPEKVSTESWHELELAELVDKLAIIQPEDTNESDIFWGKTIDVCKCLPGFCICGSMHYIYKKPKDENVGGIGMEFEVDRIDQSVPSIMEEIQKIDDVDSDASSCSCLHPVEEFELTPVTSGTQNVIHPTTPVGHFERQTCERPKYQISVLIVKPEAVKFKDVILRAIKKEGLDIINERYILLTPEQAAEIYTENYGGAYFALFIQQLSASPILVLSIAGLNAIERWNDAIGRQKCIPTSWFFPNSVKRRFGIHEDVCDAMRYSDDYMEAATEMRYFFPLNILEPISISSIEVQDYCDKNIHPTLLKGLHQLLLEKPDDPISFLAEWLLLNNPFQPFYKQIHVALSRT